MTGKTLAEQIQEAEKLAKVGKALGVSTSEMEHSTGRTVDRLKIKGLTLEWERGDSELVDKVIELIASTVDSRTPANIVDRAQKTA